MPLQPKTILLKVYLTGILLIGSLVSSLPEFGLALTLLILQIYTIIKPVKPSLNIALLTATIILTPLTLVPLTGNLLAVLFIIPAIYLLDRALLDNNVNQQSSYSKTQRTATAILKMLTTALFVVFVAALTFANPTLLLSTGTLISYLVIVFVYSISKIPLNPLKENKTWNRIIVGNITSNRIQVSSKTNLPLNIMITTKEPWVKVTPSKLTLTGKHAEVNVTFTPPLAGPSKLQLQTTAVDRRGLIQFNQTLEPIDLHIIPRAKYAQWLAEKFLKQTAAGTTTAALSSQYTFRAAKQGVEYFGNRLYVPGDLLKDIDWKHTAMVNELTVKEYAGAKGQPTIIVADLTTKNAADADKLSYNLAMTALTAAVEVLPSALAVFNQKEVIATTALANPRETLKEALKITQKISIVDFPIRVTQPTEIYKLNKATGEVHQTTEPKQKLMKILELEYEATQRTIRTHPANKALTKATEKTSPPAMITVVSKIDYDVDAALMVTLEKLKKKGYDTLTLKT
jgi:uncharacterized protein (DUF58 family)